MKYNNYCLTDDRILEIYEDKNILNLFNNINKKTCSNINLIKKLLNKKIFKVPSYKKKVSWGYETIFIPFTNKLFKIIETKYNDTSLQLHPIKNETWYPLKKVVISDGAANIKVDNNTIINIPSKTIHNLSKGSIVFEVQDNIPFNYNETYRIYDKSKRKIQPSIFNAYHYLNENKINLISDELIVKNKTLSKDSFIYSKNENIVVEVDGITKKINKNELWFLSKGTRIINKISNAILIEVKYIKAN